MMESRSPRELCELVLLFGGHVSRCNCLERRAGVSYKISDTLVRISSGPFHILDLDGVLSELLCG